MNIEIANRLHQLRKKHNLSQEDLASKIGISRQAVSKWERAEASPDTDNLISLAKLYGVSLDELLMTDSYPLNQNEPVSLKKDNYAAAGIATPAMSISPDGEIYPNRTNNSSQTPNASSSNNTAGGNSQGNVSFSENGNNTSDGLFGNNSNPYASNSQANNSTGPDAADFEKIDEYMSKIGSSLDAGFGKLGNGLEKVGKVVGNNIDKAGNKIKEEIRKSEEKNRSNTYSSETEKYSETSNDSSYKYNYEYEYEYNHKKHKRERSKSKHERITLSDWVLTMIFVMLFGLTISTIGESALAFIFAIPTLLTYKIAKKRKDLLCFCYPTLICMIFFGLSIFGSRTYEYTWTLFVTIPLFYTAIPAIRKRNPLIFCYPVLVAYFFLLSAVLFNGFFVRWTWSLFLTIPFYYIICRHIMAERNNNNTQ